MKTSPIKDVKSSLEQFGQCISKRFQTSTNWVHHVKAATTLQEVQHLQLITNTMCRFRLRLHYSGDIGPVEENSKKKKNPDRKSCGNKDIDDNRTAAVQNVSVFH